MSAIIPPEEPVFPGHWLEVCEARKKLPRGFVRLVWEIMPGKQPGAKAGLEDALRTRSGVSDTVPTVLAVPKYVAIHHRFDGVCVRTVPELVGAVRAIRISLRRYRSALRSG